MYGVLSLVYDDLAVILREVSRPWNFLFHVLIHMCVQVCEKSCGISISDPSMSMNDWV